MSLKNEAQNQAVQQDQIAPNSSEKKSRSVLQFLLAIWMWICRSPLSTLCGLILAGSLIFCLVVAPTLGIAAGTATGSWRGVTQGIAAGVEAGKEAGLSAEDTVAVIGNKMIETANLQVMLVDLKVTDLYQQGNDYAALLNISGNGVFSVDLTQAEVTYNAKDNEIKIKIPEPVFTPYLDDSTLDIVEDSDGQRAEYNPRFFNGSTINGYTGYLHSKEQIEQKAQEEMQAMLEPAKNATRTRVELLAKSVCGSTASVQVSFIGEEG